jgi:flagellar motility protein MotE (MotC chaperone)
MIARLQSPLAIALLSLVLSVAGGLVLSWSFLERAVLAAAEAARQPSPEMGELRRKGWDFWTIEIENLSSELKEERLQLKKQMEALERRAARLAAEEKEFAKVRAELERLRREIGEKVIEIAADESKNIRSLAATYANLTPRAAVAIFREMDDVTVVKILASMKPDAIGPIFEELSRPGGADDALARRAAILSEKLRLIKTRAAASP